MAFIFAKTLLDIEGYVQKKLLGEINEEEYKYILALLHQHRDKMEELIATINVLEDQGLTLRDNSQIIETCFLESFDNLHNSAQILRLREGISQRLASLLSISASDNDILVRIVKKACLVRIETVDSLLVEVAGKLQVNQTIAKELVRDLILSSEGIGDFEKQ